MIVCRKNFPFYLPKKYMATHKTAAERERLYKQNQSYTSIGPILKKKRELDAFAQIMIKHNADLKLDRDAKRIKNGLFAFFDENDKEFKSTLDRCAFELENGKIVGNMKNQFESGNAHQIIEEPI